LSVYSLGRWIYESFFSITQIVDKIKDINDIFFDEFLLFDNSRSAFYYCFLSTDKFSKVIRNSGFIISTLLIKISFGTEGILIRYCVTAVLFAIILAIHNKYETLEELKASQH
jgi:hypothetical protein